MASAMQRFGVMDPVDREMSLVELSRRLIVASRDLVQSSTHHVEMTTQRLDRARNRLQALWLRRAAERQVLHQGHPPS